MRKEQSSQGTQSAKSEFKSLAESYETSVQYINVLIKRLVPREILEEVLNVKDVLTKEVTAGPNVPPVRGKSVMFGAVHSTVSADTLAQAYHIAQGDLELLKQLADKANELIDTYDLYGAGAHTYALRRVLSRYLSYGSDFFEMDEELFGNTLPRPYNPDEYNEDLE